MPVIRMMTYSKDAQPAGRMRPAILFWVARDVSS